MSERSYSAQSPADANATEQIPAQGSTPEAPQPPVDPIEAVYTNIDAGLITAKSYPAITYMYEQAKQIPDVSDSLTAALGRVVHDHQEVKAEYGTDASKLTPLIYENELRNLGAKEIALSMHRHNLRVSNPEVAENPRAKADEIALFIDAQIALATDDEKLVLEKHKQQLAGLPTPEKAAANEAKRQELPTRYYEYASTLARSEGATNRDEELIRLKSATRRLANDEAKEAQALNVIHAYLPKLEKAATTPDVTDKKAELARIEAEIGAIYAKREYKTKKWFGQPQLKGEHSTLLEDYRAKSNELFKLENADMLADPDTDDAQKIMAITLHTIKQGRALEDAKDVHDGRSWFRKKIIHGLGRAMTKHPYWAAGIGAVVAAGTSAVTFGLGAGVTGGVAAYAARDYKQHEARLSKDKIIKDDEDTINTLHDDIKDEIEQGNLSLAALDKVLEYGMEDNERVFDRRANEEQRRRLGSVAIGVGVFAAGSLAAHVGLNALSGGGDVHATPDGDSISGDVGAHGGAGDFGHTTPVPDELKGSWFDPNAGSVSPDVSGTPDFPSSGPDLSDIPQMDGSSGDLPSWGNPDVALSGSEFAPDTFYAHNGDGFYDILKNMGVESWQRDDVLAKASQELIDKGFAYKMEDGLPGIPRVGELPQGAIDILLKAAGK